MINFHEVHWAADKSQLPAQHSDVYSNFGVFLERVVSWMSDRRHRSSKRCNAAAMEVIRKEPNVFPGIGVYSVTEVFHKAGKLSSELSLTISLIIIFAGLPPGITESELFESADRTARFCVAFYTFASEAHTELWYV